MKRWLSEKDTQEYEQLKNDIINLLAQNEIAEIVPQGLYLTKNGDWHTRFAMSGYSLGKPNLVVLLKEFVIATAGIEISERIIRKQGPTILGKFIWNLKFALYQLQKVKDGTFQ